MSLLIKALDKAQNAKTEQIQAEKNKTSTEIKNEVEANNKPQSQSQYNLHENLKDNLSSGVELSLSPTGTSFTESSTKAASTVVKQNINNLTSNTPTSSASLPTSQPSPKNAANVFSAKGSEAQNNSQRLVLIAGAGLIALLAMGLYFYQFMDNSPDLVVPQRPLQQLAIASSAAQQQAENNMNEIASSAAAESTTPPVFEPADTTQFEKQQSSVKTPAVVEDDEFDSAENTAELDEPIVAAKQNKKISKSKKLQFGEAIASESASINVTKSTAQTGVSPVLMSAYEAYNAGNDAEAQRLYKQVLQRDVRNVDALLGLGAIASRQGRLADANGWYGKVLEVDPRNNIARAALLDSQSQGNEQANESQLKNMLAKQPDDANLHVALGNLYAEQNQWPAAQQAYFDAYRLNASADNAYNLAVSLDQIGKPKLALPYYQHALAHASATSNIDKAALEARIAAIQ